MVIYLFILSKCFVFSFANLMGWRLGCGESWGRCSQAAGHGPCLLRSPRWGSASHCSGPGLSRGGRSQGRQPSHLTGPPDASALLSCLTSLFRETGLAVSSPGKHIALVSREEPDRGSPPLPQNPMTPPTRQRPREGLHPSHLSQPPTPLTSAGGPGSRLQLCTYQLCDLTRVTVPLCASVFLL